MPILAAGFADNLVDAEDYRFSAPAKINSYVHRAEASAISLV